MPIVNYVREHIRFMEYCVDENLTSSERLLWYALMHIMNQRANGNVWPGDFICIRNDRLLSYCPMKFDTLAKARNSLKQRGLIEYRKGEKNKELPAYRMIYFDPIPEFYPKKSDNRGYNKGDNRGYNKGDNSGDIYINYRPIQETGNPDTDEEDDKNNVEHKGRGAATLFKPVEREIARVWKTSFGEMPTPQLVLTLGRWFDRLGFQDFSVIRYAIENCATRCANDPAAYIIALLKDWHTHGVRDENSLDWYIEFGNLEEYMP